MTLIFKIKILFPLGWWIPMREFPNLMLEGEILANLLRAKSRKGCESCGLEIYSLSINPHFNIASSPWQYLVFLDSVSWFQHLHRVSCQSSAGMMLGYFFSAWVDGKESARLSAFHSILLTLPELLDLCWAILWHVFMTISFGVIFLYFAKSVCFSV